MKAKCPVCSAETVLLRTTLEHETKNSLFILLGQAPPSQVRISNYELHRCVRCELEFATPMIPGDTAFYDWITAVQGYYPESRPEWEFFFREIESDCNSTGNQERILVDIGCGDGSFLKAARTRLCLRHIGLDLSRKSVEACQSAGVEAYQGRAEDGLPFANEGVSIFTLWHIVEHVDKPKEILGSLKPLLDQTGKIFFSVPLSPTSAEVSAPDPLNLPPHHLTRWTVNSLIALAEELGFTMKLYFPPAQGPVVRSLLSFRLQACPIFQDKKMRHVRLMYLIFTRPIRFANELMKQMRRAKYDGHDLPDVVMVRLTR